VELNDWLLGDSMVLSKRVFEDIVQVIKTDIASNKLKPNHKLGSERSLSQRFKVGRGSIREAIKTLEAIGLVTLKNGRGGGIFVSETANQQTTSALSSLLKLEKSNLLESLEFRKMIEPRMTFYAAVRRTKENIKVLLKSINQMKQDLNSPENFSKANLSFHLEIAKASHNPFLYSFYQNTITMLDDTAKLVQDVPSQLDLTIHFHTQIYEAVLEKDPQKSEMLMNAHLSQIENDIRIARDLAVDRM
jgi:GntR family transcriptional repressor for pyruvate dehydrogenase complex